MPAVGCALWCVLLASVSAAQTVAPPVRVAVAEATAGEAARLLESAGSLPMPVAARVLLTDPRDPAAEARLATLERAGVPLWLAVTVPDTPAAVDDWRRALRAIVERRASTLAILEVVVDRQPAAVAVYALQVAATDARARRPAVRIALGGDAIADTGRSGGIEAATVAPYLDLAVVSDDLVPAVTPWLRQLGGGAKLAIISRAATTSSPDPVRRIVDDVLADVGTEVAVRAWRAADVTPGALTALAPVAALLTGDLQPLDAAAVGVALTVDGRNVAADVRPRLLFDTRTFSTYLVYSGAPSPVSMQVTLTLPIEGRPAVRNVVTGERAAAEGYSRDAASGRVTLRVPLTGGPMLVDFNEEATVMADRGEVTAARQLSVAEIIARHQQAQAAQDAVVRNYSASARMRQHFRPTVTDPGYDVVTENRYFVEGPAVEWEEISFAVNGSRWEGDRPPFPMLQPEKVLSLPLQLRFDEGYRYELDGTEQVDGVDCYVVRFEPVRADSSLYKGTVWIDRRTFARLRVRAVQNGLPAPVVSNEETLRYVHAGTVDNQPVFLFGGLTARQILLVAGRNLLVEKEVTFSSFSINDAQFEGSRTEARRGDRIMYRETERGLRYYVKQGDERVISDNPTTSVKAMAMGVYLDPSYAFPLPIFGINYLNFGLGASDRSQLALLFGGVLVAGNVQRPKLGPTPFDGSIDFFAIAAPSSDRLYRGGGEAEDERVLTWPMSTGVNVGWQATPYQKATFQYQLRGDFYVRDRTTAVTFVPPSSTLTNGLGGAWEYRRGGYSVLLNGTWFVRNRWNAWGPEGAPAPHRASKTYVKYGVGVSRTMLVGPFQTVYVNGNWFGGRDLDRFVQYQFGMFDDTRIHGVPASGVRFAELGMARGSYSLNIFEQYRLDVFVEHAWGRDRDAGVGWQRIPAVGTAVNFRTYWNTILRAELGRSALPSRYDGLGSTTLQILLLKPLR